jgi:iron(III) transport system substrate-binding protein
MPARWSSSAALVLLLAACGRAPARDEVVLYCAHDLLLAEPILREHERRTGVAVRVVADTEAAKTTGLVNRLIQMRARPEADVFWSGEVMNTVRLAELGMLARRAPASAADVPAEHRDPEGRWVGFAARARVILYNTDLVAPADAPRSLLDLTRPAFRGRVVIANPLFGTTATHAAALFAALGPERARELFRALAENGCRVAAGNAAARNLVADGEIAVCLTDSDDANGALRAGKPVEMVYPDQDGLGTLVIPNTVVELVGAPHPEAARALVEFLASREVEELLARAEGAQMPLRAGLAPHGPRFDLAGIRAMEVDWRAVAAQQEASRAFLQELFLE